MKTRVLLLALALGGAGFGWTSQAQAVGCISGGLAGAVAGHMVHHGVLGAIGGCVAGHEYHKHQVRAQNQNLNGGSYQPPSDRTTQ